MAASILLAAAPASYAGPDAALRALSRTDVFVDPALTRLVSAERLRYAASVASRVADGAPIKVAFVDVADERLDAFRDRLYGALRLGPGGALIVATPVSITMRTAILTPSAEEAIIERDAEPLRMPPRRYTESLAELVYDTGLVIHNSTPGAVPRGDGLARDLRGFPGTVPGESRSGGGGRLTLALAAAAGGAVAAVLVARRRRRTARR